MPLKTTTKRAAKSSLPKSVVPKSRTAKAAAVKSTAQAATETGAAPARTPSGARAADNTRPVTFSLYAPEAGSVQLAGDFTQWESAPVSLTRQETGLWSATLKLPPGRYQYRLLVDGQWQNDPHCPELVPNQFGTANCVCAVTA